MKKLLLFVCFSYTTGAFAQTTDEAAIRAILNNQTEAWNKGDVNAFMSGYWKNDSLLFVGKNGVTYGWNNTLKNYQKNYPDKTAMGILSFDILLVKKQSPEFYYVVGKWQLIRTIGNLSGHYTLIFQKMNNEWVIVADHSS